MQYQRLCYEERMKIEFYRSYKFSISDIAFKLKRSKSTISRELSKSKRKGNYDSIKAHELAKHYEQARNRTRKLDNPKLYRVVYELLQKRWSPEQISVTLKSQFPNDKSMQVSHETIYTYIYVLGRGELKRELKSFLRQKKEARKRAGGRTSGPVGKASEITSIVERPKDVEDRSLAGDWEGDLVVGKNHLSAIGTLVERKTRLVLLVPLKAKKAPDVRIAFEKALGKLPKQVLKSLTYDQGPEMAQHRLFEKNTKMKVYFCDPGSPWQRGTCENTNGLIRDYFPKGTDFSKVSTKELKRVQKELNERPRKTLNFRTPKEVFVEEIMKIVPLDS